MAVVTRFAPSPTGRLHVGNIRTALLSALFARQRGGRFVLRIDDTDAERSEERYVEAIGADLAWLGLAPDDEVRQSQRFDRYEDRFRALVDGGRIYPAYETRAGTRPQAQGPTRSGAAADLRSRCLVAVASRPGGTGGGWRSSALALQARP